MKKNLHKGRLVFPLSSDRNINRRKIGQDLHRNDLTLLIQPHNKDSSQSKQQGEQPQIQLTAVHSSFAVHLHLNFALHPIVHLKEIKKDWELGNLQ